MHSPLHDPAALRGEPTTRVDIPALTPRRRFVAVARVSVRRCTTVLRVAMSGFRVDTVVLLAVAPLAIAAVLFAGVLDSPRAAELHGRGVLSLAQVFRFTSPFYVISAAAMAGLQRWRGARDFFVAWVLVLIAGHAVARHQSPVSVVSSAADSRASAASSTSRSVGCS